MKKRGRVSKQSLTITPNASIEICSQQIQVIKRGRRKEREREREQKSFKTTKKKANEVLSQLFTLQTVLLKAA